VKASQRMASIVWQENTEAHKIIMKEQTQDVAKKFSHKIETPHQGYIIPMYE
jgi:hypothetical protein